MMYKSCTLCGIEKPLTEYHSHPRTKDGFKTQCRTCQNEKNKQWRDKNAEYLREYNQQRTIANYEANKNWRLQKLYGISLDEYKEILLMQGGGCAICGRPPTKEVLFVDHEHESGEIRGLLCRNCNTGIGLLGDGIEGILSALEYLEQ